MERLALAFSCLAVLFTAVDAIKLFGLGCSLVAFIDGISTIVYFGWSKTERKGTHDDCSSSNECANTRMV